MVTCKAKEWSAVLICIFSFSLLTRVNIFSFLYELSRVFSFDCFANILFVIFLHLSTRKKQISKKRQKVLWIRYTTQNTGNNGVTSTEYGGHGEGCKLKYYYWIRVIFKWKGYKSNFQTSKGLENRISTNTAKKLVKILVPPKYGRKCMSTKGCSNKLLWAFKCFTHIYSLRVTNSWME